MSIDELAVMDGGKCILQVQGVRPFFSSKYDITKHKRYRELSDYNKKNAVDVTRLVHRRLTLNPNDTYTCVEYEAASSET